MKYMLTGISAALLTAGCASMGGGMGANTSASAMPTDAMGYVAMAGSSDMYEIESSRLALQRTQSPAVRQFAQMMIDHHTATTQQVMLSAQSAGMMPPPPMLMPPHRAMLDKLQPAGSAGFDRMYVEQQRVAHRMALGLHRNYADRGDTAPLKTTAAAAVPIIQRHIEQLQTMPTS